MQEEGGLTTDKKGIGVCPTFRLAAHAKIRDRWIAWSRSPKFGLLVLSFVIGAP
jgi:hypothetical protein